MQRRPENLQNREYDIVIIGGGIFGICTAWEAASRGLSVALIEKRDFAHAASANCFKIVHGGIRYLQHGDLVRVRESSIERSVFLRVAPHLVKPLPIVIPTYGHGLKGKEALALGMWCYDWVTFDRNRFIRDPARKIPSSRMLSREEVLGLFPDLPSNRLTGGGIIYDGQMYSPARLALAFLHSAVRAGAEVANYIEAIGFLKKGQRVFGVVACDRLTGQKMDIRGKLVVNAGGAWTESLLGMNLGERNRPRCTYSRDACFVVNRPLSTTYALAVSGRTKDPDALISRQHRHLFIVPWRNRMLVGVWHKVYEGDPDKVRVTDEELQAFIDEVNDGYPGLRLTLDEVALWQAGLVLFGHNKPGSQDLSYGKRSRLIDHQCEHGIEGLVTLIGVRYTMARREAEKVIDLAARKLDQPIAASKTAVTPLFGGEIENVEKALIDALRQCDSHLHEDSLRSLFFNYGSARHGVLEYGLRDPQWFECLPHTTVIKAEIIHAIQHEMACTLDDIVFRRTDLGTAGHPGDSALLACADLMANFCRWSEARKLEELDNVKKRFRTMNASGTSEAIDLFQGTSK